jgi:hypothetical protein
MSELKAETIVPQGSTVTLQMYSKADVDRVITEKDKEIAKLKADYKEACDRLQTANLIKDEQKAKADELLMKVSGLEKLMETADKVLKEKGGFTVKDITFKGVKVE